MASRTGAPPFVIAPLAGNGSVCALCAADGHGKALAIALMLMATAQLTEGDEHSQAGTQGSGRLSVRSVLGTRPSQSVS